MQFNSLVEVTEYFSDQEKCVNFLKNMRWADGKVICPKCNHDKVYELRSTNKRFKCAGCKRQFSITVGTIFENSPIPLKKWFIAMYLYSFHKKGISSVQLGKDLGVTQKTAWYMAHRIRHMLKTKSMEKIKGIIEVDETFVGGKNKNRPWNKKVKNSQGRSFKDKTPVFGALEREESYTIERPHKSDPSKTVKEKIVTKPSQIHCYVVPDTKSRSIQPIIRDIVEKGSVVISDEWFAYRGLDDVYQHEVIDHGRGQYMNESGFTTNSIEGAWSHFKRAIIGIYHQVSRKHLQRYCDEFTYRYNTRTATMHDRFVDTIKMSECRITYKELVGIMN